MAEVETLRPQDNLTGTDSTQESNLGSADPTGTQSTDDTSTKNWQKALQDKVDIIKQKENEAAELRAKLRDKEEAEKRKKLEEMSEVEILRATAEEETQKRGKLEMSLLVQKAIAGKNILPAVVEMIQESPWSIPAVARELGNDFTWDQAIESVGRHLPDYVNSLVVDSNTGEKEPEVETRIDTERSTGSAIGATHVYSLEEIKALAKDPVEYEKHRNAILRQVSQGQLA